jgi:hypothetical protein
MWIPFSVTFPCWSLSRSSRLTAPCRRWCHPTANTLKQPVQSGVIHARKCSKCLWAFQHPLLHLRGTFFAKMSNSSASASSTIVQHGMIILVVSKASNGREFRRGQRQIPNLPKGESSSSRRPKLAKKSVVRQAGQPSVGNSTWVKSWSWLSASRGRWPGSWGDSVVTLLQGSVALAMARRKRQVGLPLSKMTACARPARSERSRTPATAFAGIGVRAGEGT